MRKVVSFRGHAAGRDVKVEVNLARPCSTVESKLLDMLPKRCHAEVQQLLKNGDFTASGLYEACKRGALWTHDGRLARRRVLLDYLAGTLFLAKALVIMSLVLIEGVEIDTVEEAYTIGGRLMGLLTLCAAMVWISLKFFIWPQQTAREAVRCIETSR